MRFCPVPDAGDYDSEFETSSSDEDIPSSKTRKTPAATIIQPVPLENNFLVELRLPSSKLNELSVQPAPQFTADCETLEPAQGSGPLTNKRSPHSRKNLSIWSQSCLLSPAPKMILPLSLPTFPKPMLAVTVLFRPLDKDQDLSKVHPKTLQTTAD